MAPDTAAPNIGHNNPPSIDTYRELNESLPAYIEIEEKKLFDRFGVLKESFARAPATVDSPEADAKMTDFDKKQFGELKSALKDAHGRYKRPFLDGGATVDGLFKRLVDQIETMQSEIRKRQTAYKLKQEAEARRKAQEEARRQAEIEQKKREEAERLAAKARTEKQLNNAIAAETAAKQAEADRIAAEEAAAAKPAELTRSRGDQGGVSSLRSEWKVQVEDRAKLLADPAILAYISADALDQAARAWLKVNAPKDFDAAPPVLGGCKVWVHKFTR